MDPDFDKLVEYIRQQLDENIDESTIRDVLASHKVAPKTIDRAIDTARLRQAMPLLKLSPDNILAQKVSMPPFLAKTAFFGSRIGPLGYCVGQVYIGCITFLFIGVTLGLGRIVNPLDTDWAQFAFLGLGLFYMFSVILLEISLLIRRTHDVDRILKSDWLSQYLFYGITIAFGVGDKEANQYGPPPAHSFNPIVVLGLRRAKR